MTQADNNDPYETKPTDSLAASLQPAQKMTNLPPLATGRRRPEVEEELVKWHQMSETDQDTALRAETEGHRLWSHEALVHICRQAYKAGDNKRLNLAFEALTRAATPLLLFQVRYFPQPERGDQVQEIMLRLFKAITVEKADFAEFSFAAFGKRRAVELFRSYKARFEAVHDRIEPDQDGDPVDELPGTAHDAEMLALYSIAREKLPANLRTVFLQYYKLGLNMDEIAAQHGITASAVGKRLKKATDMLSHSGDTK